jgi:hypothetical protein
VLIAGKWISTRGFTDKLAPKKIIRKGKQKVHIVNSKTNPERVFPPALRTSAIKFLLQKLLASGASAFLALPTAARRKDSFGISFAVDNMHFLFAFSYDFFRCQLVCEASCRNPLAGNKHRQKIAKPWKVVSP